ncbi:hypothetical protein MRB53_038434 [Persea americana]|nr:hypothetical protein MRB53_038434 [Persea americana]
MVKVATSLDVPIKMLFPRPADPENPLDKALSMLGLGDIVIPGVLIGLALRFDYYQHYLRLQEPARSNSSAKDKPSELPSQRTTPAFVRLRVRDVDHLIRHAALQSRTASLAIPGARVLGSLWGRAWMRGELKAMWSFSDAVEDEEKDQGVKPKDGEDKVEQAEGSKQSSEQSNVETRNSAPNESLEANEHRGATASKAKPNPLSRAALIERGLRPLLALHIYGFSLAVALPPARPFTRAAAQTSSGQRKSSDDSQAVHVSGRYGATGEVVEKRRRLA